MILSAHAVFGAAIASLVPTHPVEAFALGFASHIALDFIPHKDYELISLEAVPGEKVKIIDKIHRKFKLIRDMIFVSFDALFGFCLAFLFFFNPAYPWIFFLGALGSMMPDFLLFLYLVSKHRALSSLFKFHVGIGENSHIKNLNQVWGVILQFCTVAVLIIILFLTQYFILA